MKKNNRFRIVALILVFAMLLPLAACGRKSGGSGSCVLVMTTEKGAVLIGDAGHELVPKNTDSSRMSDDYTKSVYLKGSKLYWFDGKNEEQITKDCGALVGAAGDLSAVLYTNKDGDLLLWTSKGRKETGTGVDGLNNVNYARFSGNGKYAAVFCTGDDGDDMIWMIELSEGTAVLITEEKVSRVVCVTDDGTVFYRNDDSELVFANGRKETVLAEEITFLYYDDPDSLLLYLNDDDELISRGTGEKDKETVLAEDVASWFPVLKTAAADVGYISDAPGTYWFRSMAVFRNDDGEMWVVNVKSGKTSLLFDEDDAEDYDYMLFLDEKTAYAVMDGEAVYMTLSGEKWKYERVCDAGKRFSVTYGGRIMAMDGDTVYLLDGGTATEISDEVVGPREFADDGKSLVFVDDGDVMYVSKPGARAEKLAKDALAGTSIYLMNGKIYYLNEDSTLCAIDSKGKVEEIAEDIRGFIFMRR